MTGHQINSLVGDLVAMAQAMERLPIAEHELEVMRNELGTKGDTIQRLELKLLDRAAEIEKLHASIRELEVAKDAAETMFLEADDRTTRALEFVKTMFGSAGSLIQALEPAKAEVVHAVDPIVVAQPDTTEVSTASVSNAANATGEGQSEPDPTPKPSVNSPAEDQSQTSASESVIHMENAPTDKPYFGRLYFDVPQYVPYHEWIAGGGTDADYYWRPGRPF